jgi:amino acid transporter, AAT family
METINTISGSNEKHWRDERELQNKTFLLLSGIINLCLALILSEIVWYVAFSPSGIMRLYTPNVGVCLVITILMVIHWGTDVFDFFPFSRKFLNETNPILKGILLSVIYIVLGIFIMFVFYYNILGRFGAIFFSGPMLAQGGGLGQYSQTATENASYAQIMMNTSIIFCTVLWLVGFGYHPWQSLDKGTRGFSVWCLGLLLAIISFVFLFYPHIGYQFYPPQLFMAAPPWWSEWAMTQSSMFHFGWMVPALVLLYWTDMLWEGRPFCWIKTPLLRGIATAAAVVVAAIILMLLANRIMDWYFETEAFEGGATVEQPAWRWNHVAEIAMFMAAVGSVLFHYFDNWPRKGPLIIRAVVRTAIAFAGGLGLMWLYYALGPIFLGTVPGVAQEGDTSLAWTVMFIIIVVSHSLFFDGFPMKKLKKEV